MQVDVARVITRLNIGGPSRHVLMLSEGLTKHGFRTCLVSGSEATDEGHLAPGNAIDHLHLPQLVRPVQPRSDVVAYRALAAAFRARRPEVVHTHMAKAGALGRWAALRERVPVIVHTFHGHVLDGYFGKSAATLFTATERVLARKSDALIAVSPAIRDELLDLGLGSPKQWHVIRLGLDLTPLLSSSLDQGEARKRLNLPASGPLIGIVGRLVPIKNHGLFVRIAERVASVRRDAHFVIAGSGELRGRVEASLPEWLRPRIHFLGWVEDLPSLYNAVDLVVLTSLKEGTPVALIEAAAAARCAVATDVGGVRSVVEDGRTGYLFPSDDAVMGAQLVLDALADPEKRSAMAAEARVRAATRFGHQRLLTEVAELYEQLLQDRRGRRRRRR